jgi:hypothetical protein
MIAKCANKTCTKVFEYHAGGCFFRFSKASASPSFPDATLPALGNTHEVEHFWLCSHCARVGTLVYLKGAGILLKPRNTEDPPAETMKKSVAA